MLDPYRIYFEWSNPAQFDEITLRDAKVLCNSSRTHSAYAIGNYRLLPGYKYFWEIKCENGVNFKVGIVKSSFEPKKDLNISDVCLFSSRGMVQSQGSEKGVDTTFKYSAGDTLGVHFDGVKGSLTYFLNGKRLGTFFVSSILKQEVFQPIVYLMTEGELLSVSELVK